MSDIFDKWKSQSGGVNSTASSETKQNSSDLMSKWMSNERSTRRTDVSSGLATEVPTVQNVPTTSTKSSESPISADVISQYESMPNYNFVQRLFDPSKKKAYEDKQALLPEYEKAKDSKTAQMLSAYGLTDDDLLKAPVTSANDFSISSEWLKSKGLSDDEITSAKEYMRRVGQGITQTKLSDFADEHKVLGTALTFPAKIGATVAGTTENVVKNALGIPLSQNDVGNSMSNTVSSMRNSVSDDFNGVGQFAYGIGTSIGDMIPTLALGGTPGLAYAGLSAAQDSVNGSLERGLTSDQVMANALFNGLAEAALEKLPLGRLEKLAQGVGVKEGAKGIAQMLLAQMGSEALEEGGTDIANLITDAIVSGDKSEFNLAVKDYEKTLSHEEAVRKAILDEVKTIGLDALAGGISGGIMGGVAIPIGKANAELDNLGFSGNLTEETNPSYEAQKGREARVSEEQNANPSDINSLMAKFNRLRAEEDAQGEANIQNAQALANMANRMAEEQSSAEVPNLSELLGQANQIPNMDDEFMPYATAFNDRSEVVEKNLLAKYGEDSAEYNKYMSAKERIKSALQTNDEARLKSALATVSTLADPDAKALLVLYANGMDIGDINVTNQSSPEVVPTFATDVSYRETIPSFDPNVRDVEVPNGKKSRSKLMAEDIGLRNRNTTERTLADGTETLTEEIPYLKRGADGSYTSQTASNTVYRGVASEDEQTRDRFEKQMNDGEYRQMPKSEVESQAEAQANIRRDGEEATIEKLKNKETWDSTDVDENMQLLKEARKKAVEDGDYSRFDDLTRLIVAKSHKIGQALQALAKYSRTPEGSMQKTQVLANAFTRNFFGKPRNKTTLEKCGKLALALKNMGYDGTMDVPTLERTHENLVERVRNTMGDEYSSISSKFTDADYEYIARLIEGNYSTDDISARLQQRMATGYWGMSTEDMQKVVDLFNEADKVGINSREAAKLLEQAYAIEAKYIGGATMMDIWNEWRYLAMLGNPRTHIRNMIGNLLFGTVTDIKDNLNALIQTQYEKAQIKKGNTDYKKDTAFVSKKTDPELFKACDEDFEQEGFGLATDDGHKYNMADEIERARKKWKPAELNNKALDGEDNWAIKRKYVRSLASYLKAQNLDPSILKSTDPIDMEIANKARTHAIAEAQEATFHLANKFASRLSEFSRNNAADGGVAGTLANIGIEAMVPFKKTPANILKEGIEYSPAGIFKAIRHIRSQADANTVINDISKTMTGSAIMMLGGLLGALGILRGSNDDDADEMFGDQNYSLNIGDASYTIDWAAPAALPLFMGVELQKVWDGEDAQLGDALLSLAEPMVELSMLQGIKNTIKSISQSSQNGAGAMISGIGANLGANYLSQAVPTLFGQIARSIDDTRRSTYTDADSTVGQAFGYQAEKMLNKIPGLSMLNEAYINEFGEEEKNDGLISGLLGTDSNFIDRLLYNTLSPGYVSNTARTPYEAELERLHDADTEKNPLPSSPSKSYNKERIDEKDYEKLSKEQGTLTTDATKKLMNTGYYKSVDDEAKAQLISKLRGFCTALAKSKVLGYDIANNSTYKNAYKVYTKSGIDGVIKYYNGLAKEQAANKK